jgi:hypothetical protein
MRLALKVISTLMVQTEQQIQAMAVLAHGLHRPEVADGMVVLVLSLLPTPIHFLH